jgi:hypothetical protein
MRKRSKYKPKGVRYDTMAYVKSGLLAVGAVPEAGVMLKAKNHAAMDEILKGRGTKDHVDVLIGMVNVAEALAQDKELGSDWQEEIRAGQDALLEMAVRGIKRGSFAFTGPELKAVNLVLEIHDEQLSKCPVKRMEEALGLVNTVIKHKRARRIIDHPELA